MKKTLIISFLFLILANAALSCALGPGYVPDPYFIEDNIVNEVHYDAVFFENVRNSSYKQALINEAELDNTVILKEWEDYLAEKKIDVGLEQLFTSGYSWANLPESVKNYLITLLQVNPDLNPWVPTPVISAEAVSSGRGISVDADDFLRRRYAYLQIKVYNEMKEFNQVIKYYQDNFVSDEKMDVPRYRAMGYYARALLKLDRKQEALNTYLLRYDSYIPYRIFIKRTILNNFSDDDFDVFYRSEIPAHRKATLAFVTENADKLVELEPASPRTVAFMVREAMKNEKIWLPNRWSFLFESGKIGDNEILVFRRRERQRNMEKINVIKDIKMFIKRTEKLKCSGYQDNVKSMLLGYGFFLLGDYNKAEKLYKKSSTNIDKQGKLYTQLKTFEILIDFAKDKKHFSAELQDRAIKSGTFTMLSLCANRLLTLGDYIRGAVIVAYLNRQYNMYQAAEFIVDVIATEGNIAEIPSIIKGDNKQPIDDFIYRNMRIESDGTAGIGNFTHVEGEFYSRGFLFKENDAGRLIAFKKIRNLDFAGAFKTIEKTDFQQTNLINVDITAGTSNATFANVKSILELLSELSVKTDDIDVNAKNLYTIGSVIASSRFLLFSGSNWDRYGPYYVGWMLGLDCTNKIIKNKNEFIAGKYNRFVIAYNFLKQAEATSKNAEFKAKCSVVAYDMMKKVHSDELRDLRRYSGKDYGFAKELIKRLMPVSIEIQNLLKDSRDKYSATNYYKEYISRCADFKNDLAELK